MSAIRPPPGQGAARAGALPCRAARRGGLLLCRVAGVPVVLAPSWWLGAVLITLFYAPMVNRLLPNADVITSVVLAMACAALLGLSVLAHELGHCLVALRLGLPV